jgi:pimeloyl-ACP methyl ester carboxylesterase
MLKYGDPRMWAWNIRQMGVLDLPALISRVLSETGFEKVGLIAHSQGTTQTLVALAKEQRPDISEKISVFCALAPAAYAGPLIGKMYFKFMRVIGPGMFRAMFGIHAFIPFMMIMHAILPPKLYGAMGYQVFSFLFNWTDDRWERDLRDRLFQFSPVYVSAESMRWWLGRECFAKQKCILATREEKTIEDREDEQEDHRKAQSSSDSSDSSDDDEPDSSSQPRLQRSDSSCAKSRVKYAWYGPGTPPFALWVCGADELVDGRRLLRRFERNREPYVDVVHSKIIEGYEHLDVIWAMDAIEKVGKEVREVIWKTASEETRKLCRVPRGCEDIKEEDFYMKRKNRHTVEKRELDASAGEWSAKGRKQVGGGGGEREKDLDSETRQAEKEE